MRKALKITLGYSLLIATLSTPLTATAQYRGAYPGNQEEKQVDKATKPVPKIFSSQVASVTEAQKLDILYQNLYVSLWNYAATDLLYQKKLSNLIKPERFKLTRYAQEFDGDMNNAMNNLNTNYKKLMSDIEDAQAQYQSIRDGIRSADYSTLDPLWEEKMNEFKDQSKEYFSYQNNYLQTYRKLIEFIIEEGGGYYYKPNEGRFYFYKTGTMRYYANMVDRLAQLNYKQKMFLSKYAPVNADLDDIK